MRSRILHTGAAAPCRLLSILSSRPQWTCASCRWRGSPPKAYATSANALAEKPYYITTPIFYVNAAPHVGHLYTIVLTDIFKRWQMLQGKKAILCTGTDEHGMKIQQAAAKAGSEPKEFCDKGAEVFKSLVSRADVLNDHFIRTTDPAHREAVQYAWFLLKERGYIYQSKHEGWYSVSDETFYPQSAVHLILETSTGRKIMASIETGKEVEWTSEINYHFRLSAFKDRLLQFYKQNPEWIKPRSRLNEVVNMVQGDLEDLSISRPVERLTWGIPVPDDESQTIYVWLDALMNYVTKAGYPWAPGQGHVGGWPADVHIIGKDIIKFHCIYWPAMLMALDLPLPKRVIAHGHWTMGNEKMSKSTGNVVNPFFALDRFGVDTMRFFLAHDGIIGQDTDYSNYRILERYKKSLQGGIGNLASRIMRGKGWDVGRAVTARRAYVMKSDKLRQQDQAQRERIAALPAKVEAFMEAGNPTQAVKEIMELIYETNKYLQEAEPWKYTKTAAEDPKDLWYMETIIYLCAETLRVAGILLQPWMPRKSAQLLDLLGVDESKRSFEAAQMGWDANFGIPKVEVGKGYQKVLFPPLTSDA